MPASPIADMVTAIGQRQFGALTLMNRLEGRPRTRQFDRSLRAEVRDALWMLTRQWQTGEFDGDDAGSPFFSKLRLEVAPLKKFQAGSNPPSAFGDDRPLEAVVERRPLTWVRGNALMSIDLRLLMGRHWLKLIKEIPGYVEKFRDRYPFEMPSSGDSVLPHPEIVQSFTAIVNRMMDGAQLYLYLKADASHKSYDGIVVSEIDKPALEEAGHKFLLWFERQFLQPSTENDTSWNASHLEYSFRCAHATREGESVLAADEYYQGHLDWYNFNLDDDLPQLSPDTLPAPTQTTTSLIATPVQFAGMPNTRWWEFEDRKTNFGDISASTTDLAQLLFIEFGLIYANDWFLIPCTLEGGCVAKVRGLVVTNVFGERIWVDAAGRGSDANWQRWSMFTISHRQPIDPQGIERRADNRLLLLPTLPQLQESAPIEEVMLFRDEVANMVWAIEKQVPMADGRSKPGAEAATETRAWYEQQVHHPAATAPRDSGAAIRFRLMTSAPENWVPFVPVHIPSSNREIQLQQAQQLRLIAGDSQPIEPRTTLIREGLEKGRPYFVNEEEVPRSGVQLTKSFQRARWKNGRVVVWLGLRKHVGRGEGSSGLAFDQIESPSAS